MKILVTGATGFLGGHLVPTLLACGMQVVATAKDVGRINGIPWADQVEWRQLDVFSPPPDAFVALGKPDRMIHLAWNGLPNYKDDFHFKHNLPADLLFLGSMLKGGLGHLLVTGTCFEYGMQEGALQEDGPVNPETPYGRAKNALREGLEKLSAETGSVFQWARLFYMYGPGQNPRSLFAQLQQAIDIKEREFDMSGGQQIRDYLAVESVAEFLVAILLQTKVVGIVNVSSGRKDTLQTLVEEYLSDRNAHIKLNLGVYPYPDWEPFRFWGNNDKLRSVIRGE